MVFGGGVKRHCVATLSFRLLSKWPKNGSLNYNSILQLDLFYKWKEKWDEMPYVLSFMLLYQNKPVRRKYKVMAQQEGGKETCFA